VVGFLAKVDSFSSETILSKINIDYMKAQGSYRCGENADPDDIVCQMKNGTYFYTIPSTRYPNPYYPDNFKGKVMVIQGNNTASAAEWLVSRLHQDNSIVFYGEKTSGATGNPYQLNLPSGMIVRFNTWRTFGPDGTETSYGFAPDIPMDFSDCYKATTPEELFRRVVAKMD
jgi:C-terminal processing protease CtpA/Prc